MFTAALPAKTNQVLGSLSREEVLDIACLKLRSISSRGSKKDFVDLYFILKQYSLDQIFTAFDTKFKGVNYQKLHLIKSLTYFDDAEHDPDPLFLVPVTWEEVKNNLITQALRLSINK